MAGLVAAARARELGLEPVLLEVVSPLYWPAFPWKQVQPHYDVWLPMSYWTNRQEDSGYREGFKYTEENVRRQIAIPWMSFGSDAGALAPEGLFLRSNPHPRAYGTFAIRSQRGHVVSAASPYHRVTRGTGYFLGLIKVDSRDCDRLARASGELAELMADRPEPWDAELLYHPEINVHLGTRYVAQHSERYDGALPHIFSAYNAGAHRVERWRRFPEHQDLELFTERIPFYETREYVKILTRNRAIYRGLYSEEG
jgi:hypothetical protein